MSESNMGEVIHPKIKHKRIEFSELDEDVDTVTQGLDDPEVTRMSPSAVKKLGRHITAYLSHFRTEQEVT